MKTLVPSVLCLVLFTAPTLADARPSEGVVAAKMTEGHCTQTGSGSYEYGPGGQPVAWYVSAECTEGKTLYIGDYAWKASGGGWAFDKWRPGETRTAGDLPEWPDVQQILAAEGLPDVFGGMFRMSWGEPKNFGFAKDPKTNFRNENYASFEVELDFLVTKSREKTNPMMGMHGRYEISLQRPSKDAAWAYFGSTRREESVLGPQQLSDDEFAALQPVGGGSGGKGKGK